MSLNRYAIEPVIDMLKKAQCWILILGLMVLI